MRQLKRVVNLEVLAKKVEITFMPQCLFSNLYEECIFSMFSSEPTVLTKTRLLLEDHSGQGLHCLQFSQHHVEALLFGRTFFKKFNMPENLGILQ